MTTSIKIIPWLMLSWLFLDQQLIAQENQEKNALDKFYFNTHFGAKYNGVPPTNIDYIYDSFNGVFNFLIGHKVNSFSIEAGLSQLYGNNALEINTQNDERISRVSVPYTVWSLPVGFKYDVPINQSENFNLGVLLALNFILSNSFEDRPSVLRTFEARSFSTQGSSSITNGVVTSLGLGNERMIFIRGGLFAEWKIFRKLFFYSQITKIFSSPILSRIRITYDLNGMPREDIIESSVNGYTAEIGVKVPFNAIFKKS